MTSNRGAGYSSAPRTAQRFDPLGGSSLLGSTGRSLLGSSGAGGAGGALGGSGGLASGKVQASPEEVARDMERRVHALLEESAEAHSAGDNQQGAWPAGLRGAACGCLACA